jgi:hypothetical protein
LVYDVEAVLQVFFHVFQGEVEPLAVTEGVCVVLEEEVVLVLEVGAFEGVG